MTKLPHPEFRFGKLRNIFWPIHKTELKKFLPMLFLYSLVVFNYSLLRATKDSLLITAPSSGAQALPYIKLWAILPMAFLSTLIFTRLANRFSREKVFTLILSSFLIFFFFFAFFLYPLRDYLHPHTLANWIQDHLPVGLHGLVAIFRNWTFSLFYVMSELWGTLIMSVLFWGFANEVISVKEAKRFYAILGVGANIATIIAGEMGVLLSGTALHSRIYIGGDRWGQSLIFISTTILIVGVASLFIYRKLAHTCYYKELSETKPFESEPEEVIKMGIRKNFAYLAKSKYLICIALIVLTYNISLNMVEIVWKNELQKLCPYAADYNVYMAKVLVFIGVTSTVFSLFCGLVVRRFGWFVGALVTPIFLFVTGIIFFFCALFKEAPALQNLALVFGTTPIALSAFFGSVQNCVSRSCKFTFFDTTKEMTFIPLNKESRLKGKAAIDGVGSRIGKSGGSLFYQILLISCGSVAASTPFIGLLLFAMIGIWIASIRSLGKQFHALAPTYA